MLNRVEDPSPNRIARLAGLFYLIFIATYILAAYIRSRLFVFGNAATTASNVLSSQNLFRIGFVDELVSALFFLLAAWALFVLLRPVNRNLALLFLLLNLGGVIIECANMFNQSTALILLNGASYLQPLPANQLQAMALSYLNSYNDGVMVAQLFFGTWLLPLGYLLYKSRIVPRAIGILIILDFFAVMIWFLQYFFLPDYRLLSYPGLAISLVAEFSLSLWLLIMGVKYTQPSPETKPSPGAS